MPGHKLGEIAIPRTFNGHSADQMLATRAPPRKK
jgi:ribosomal protein S19